ncbi:MAG: hypothetical protein HDR79_10020 [Bacteroides sp.]|nr:hypothetical protein [Bacteroides sp.]
MNELIKQLQSCPASADDISNYFSETAKLLMNGYVISKRGVEYEIIDIEFYLFTPEHQDVITYPRNCKAGEWFFHQSGVDLTFASTEKQFGGILIRGLREISEKPDPEKTTVGPLKCVYLLWDKFSAFEVIDAEIPIITKASKDLPQNKIKPLLRKIPVKKDKQTEKINYWKQRIEKKFEGVKIDKDLKELSDLIFTSEYRFVKEP